MLVEMLMIVVPQQTCNGAPDEMNPPPLSSKKVNKYGDRLPEEGGRIVIETGTWVALDILFTMIFSVEYSLRLWVCNVFPDHTVKKFLKTPMNMCDLLAVSPLYIEVMFAGSGAAFLRVLRAIRLVRLFRIFKLGRYYLGGYCSGKKSSCSYRSAMKLMFHSSCSVRTCIIYISRSTSLIYNMSRYML